MSKFFKFFFEVNYNQTIFAFKLFKEKDGKQCRFKRANVGGVVRTFMEIQEGNEEALRQAVATGKFDA